MNEKKATQNCLIKKEEKIKITNKRIAYLSIEEKKHNSLRNFEKLKNINNKNMKTHKKIIIKFR